MQKIREASKRTAELASVYWLTLPIGCKQVDTYVFVSHGRVGEGRRFSIDTLDMYHGTLRMSKARVR